MQYKANIPTLFNINNRIRVNHRITFIAKETVTYFYIFSIGNINPLFTGFAMYQFSVLQSFN